VFERLRRNLGLKAVALTLSLVLWGYLRLTPNPVLAARFRQQLSVPIAVAGLGRDEVARLDERQAVVAFDVAPSAAAVRPEAIRALVDVAGRGPGVYNVPVAVLAPHLALTSLSPATVTLAIERVETRRFPIAIDYGGDAATAAVVTARTAVTPAVAVVRAPTSAFAKIAAVSVELALPAVPSRFDAMVRPVARDAAGGDVVGITVEPNLVHVDVRFVAAKH